jgi:hypothetical protein
VSQPPRVGPNAGARTVPTPNSPIAVPCSSGGKLSRRMACETVIITPPPAPWMARKRIMTGIVRARPHAMDATVNSTTLAM